MSAPKVLKRRRDTFRLNAIAMWELRLEYPSAGLKTVKTIRPVLSRWLDRRHGTFTFCATQILSGHGYFRRYLFHVYEMYARKEPTAECLYHNVSAEKTTYTGEVLNLGCRELRAILEHDL